MLVPSSIAGTASVPPVLKPAAASVSTTTKPSASAVVLTVTPATGKKTDQKHVSCNALHQSKAVVSVAPIASTGTNTNIMDALGIPTNLGIPALGISETSSADIAGKVAINKTVSPVQQSQPVIAARTFDYMKEEYAKAIKEVDFVSS